MYVDPKKCALCRDARAVESGQLVIHFRDLTSIDPRAMEVRVTHSEHRRKVLASEAVLHDSFPVVGYVVVTLGADEDIEVVFVFNGTLITPDSMNWQSIRMMTRLCRQCSSQRFEFVLESRCGSSSVREQVNAVFTLRLG